MTPVPDRRLATPATRMALLPLLAAIAIMLALSIRPDVLADAQGPANHGAAALACWAMAAGFVRGVGFVPRFWLWRGLFSSLACASGIALALWRVFG